MRKSLYYEWNTFNFKELTITGHSRSAEKTGFYIKELNWVLDAGEEMKESIKRVFITHSHLDHSFFTPKYLLKDQKISIFIPKGTISYFERYIISTFKLLKEPLESFEIKEVQEGDNFEIDGYTINIIECFHSVPTVGYLFSKKEEKIFCYIGDTSIKIFEKKEILEYSLIIIECTFLDDEHEINAIDNDHIHWNQLRPIVLKNPKTLFLLIHFSLRYYDDFIKDYFKKEIEKYSISNINVFLDKENKKLEIKPTLL